MHLLTLKKLTLKLETQSKSPEFAPALDKIKRNLGE